MSVKYYTQIEYVIVSGIEASVDDAAKTIQRRHHEFTNHWVVSTLVPLNTFLLINQSLNLPRNPRARPRMVYTMAASV